VAGGDRTRADSALVAALAGGSTVEGAAATAGVGVATVYRRLKEPEFRARVDDARSESIGRAVAVLTAASTAAVGRLMKLLTAESESVQLGAARNILELGAKLREHQDLAERVRALEEQHEREKAPTSNGEGSRRWAS